MIDNAQRYVLEKLLIAGGILLDVGAAADPAAEQIRALKPQMTLRRIDPETPIADYCRQKNVPRLALLNLQNETEAALRSALPLLLAQRVDVVRFHGALRSDPPAADSLFDLAAFIQSLGFLLLCFQNDQAAQVSRVTPSGKFPNPQAFQTAAYFAVAPRFQAMFAPPSAASPPQNRPADSLIDIRALLPAHGIAPRGVVHVGAHQAEELDLYKRLGFARILFIEANPDLAEAVRQKTAGDPSVTLAACAASDADGIATLHITSADQSSSILPLKAHRTYYPGIQERRQVTVPARRLDTLLDELRLAPADFNYLHLDIQGAELKALRGAPRLLAHIEAITSEVNFEELYEGCGLIDELESLLAAHGFQPHTIASPYHASWGDAFYLRTRPPPASSAARGALTLNSLGRNGRFANQLFQYAFLRILARHHGLVALTPPWIGQHLFGHTDPPPTVQFPPLCEGRDWPDTVFPRQLFDRPIATADLWGYFQFDTAFYAPFQAFFRSLFQPVPSIAAPLQEAVKRMIGPDEARTHTLVALHIRRGDYREGLFFPAPTAWYRDYLAQLWPMLKNPRLYIASDEIAKVLPDFADYQPLTAADLNIPTLPAAGFYPDFYMLSQADVLAISNSSFSFLAAMLNERSPRCYRPNQHLARLIAFDPWNAPPLLHRDLGDAITPPVVPMTQNLLPTPGGGARSAGGVQIHGRTNTGATIVSFKKSPPATP